MNLITDLLDLEDSDIFISDTAIDGNCKLITLETHPSPHYCPSCGFKLHSKGITTRKIRHPIMQDNYNLILILKQRRWRCSNPLCSFTTNDSFHFVDKNRRVTNATDMLIVQAYRDLSASSVSIAQKYNVSDAYAHDVFDRFVHLKRLPLSDIISVDEVHLDMDDYCKYALVIQDFHTGEPIDLLRSRRSNVIEPYFSSIPYEERLKVKYLLSDMYNPYISFVDRFFPNAVSVIDSFHVVQWINRSLDNYLRKLLKDFKQRDRDNALKLNPLLDARANLPLSREVYLLQKYRWIILMNNSTIQYHPNARFDRTLNCMMNTFDYEDALFRVDPKLREFRDLKEMYVSFNSRNAGNPVQAAKELDELIHIYWRTPYSMFKDFGSLLDKYREPIINSFILVEKHGPGGIYNSRMSNGPIESLNRKVKDLKRLGRGFRNFEHFRNRFLYATRNNPTLNLTEIPEVQYMLEDLE